MTDAVEGKAARAAHLLGATDAAREEIGMAYDPSVVGEHERTVAALRNALGDVAFDAAWGAGRLLTLDEAVAEALADDAG